MKRIKRYVTFAKVGIESDKFNSLLVHYFEAFTHGYMRAHSTISRIPNLPLSTRALRVHGHALLPERVPFFLCAFLAGKMRSQIEPVFT